MDAPLPAQAPRPQRQPRAPRAQPRFVLGPDPDVAELYSDGPVLGRDDAGVDLVFPEDLRLPPNAVTLVDLRVRARALVGGEPEAFLLLPRSSIYRTPLGLAHSIGVIDRGYVGTLKAPVRNHSGEPYEVRRGQALFQLVHSGLRTPAWTVEPGSPLFDPAGTARGAGGLGSTGAAGSASAQAGAARPGTEPKPEQKE